MTNPTPFIEFTTSAGQVIQYPKSRLVFRPAAYALVVQDHKALLVESRRLGKLFLPGGGVEKGETMDTSLQRELREETGLEIEILRFLHFKEYFFYYELEDQGFHSLLFYYHCRAKDGIAPAPPALDDPETKDPRWVAIATLKPDDFHSNGDTIVQLLHELAE